MSPLQFRPRIRMPWQALAGFAAVLYVLRAALRGWDFRISVLDGLVFGTLALILAIRPLIAHLLPEDENDGEDAPDENEAAENSRVVPADEDEGSENPTP